jgi:hypothetical protein
MIDDFLRDVERPRILVCYVLWCINELPEGDAKKLREFADRMQSHDSKNGDWESIITGAMGFSSDLPSKLRDLWRQNFEAARCCGLDLTPRDFAEKIVERNFAKKSVAETGSWSP